MLIVEVLDHRRPLRSRGSSRRNHVGPIRLPQGRQHCTKFHPVSIGRRTNGFCNLQGKPRYAGGE